MSRAIRFVILLLGVTTAGWAGAEPWERFEPHRADSTVRISHDVWDAFLKRYVVADATGIHRVRYGEVTGDDRRNLATYLESLRAVAPTQLNRNEQRAYWINLYNALTVKVILDHYPVDSIRDIRPNWLHRGPWKKAWITVDGQEITLDDIEHRILRPVWRDPRVHYAVNCASLGCPNLQIDAFTAENAEGLLDDAARAYVNHPRGAAIVDGELVVSSIYRWFEEDFGGNDAGVLAHLRQYAKPKLKTRLQGRRSVDDHRYDWSLNDVDR